MKKEEKDKIESDVQKLRERVKKNADLVLNEFLSKKICKKRNILLLNLG